MTNHYDIDDLVFRTYDVWIKPDSTWVNLGVIEDPKITLTPLSREVRISQLNKQLLGRRIVGMDATADLMLHEVTKANLAKALPWADATQTSIAIAPATLGADLYDSAFPWVFHPTDMGQGVDYGASGYDNSMDITLLKGVVAGGLNLGNFDSEKMSGVPLELEFYPDRDSLPDIVLGYIGPIPA